MKLFLPSARAAAILLIVGVASLGGALCLRYGAIERTDIGLSCTARPDTWFCASRQALVTLFVHSVFGWGALAIAAFNLCRPSLPLFALALAASCLGLVLYNVGLSSLAAGLLVLSLARRAPATD
jgi:hypothetical protein